MNSSDYIPLLSQIVKLVGILSVINLFRVSGQALNSSSLDNMNTQLSLIACTLGVIAITLLLKT